MSKLKVAVLEDNESLLKDIITNLKDTNLVEVVTFATNSIDFLDKIDSSIEALILDIELCNDSLDGIDIANKLKLPVLFTSGKTKDHLDGIESINLDSEIPIQHILKPISKDKLNKIVQKFINQIRWADKSNYVTLDFKEEKRVKIRIDRIVFIETATGSSGKSNNKTIYFKDRKPETLIDFSFSKMEDKGLTPEQFCKPHQSFRVNISNIGCYKKESHLLEIEAMYKEGESKVFKIPVSENYRTEIKKQFN